MGRRNSGKAAGLAAGVLRLEDGRLSYAHREGTGPNLILIPGSFCDREQWDGVIAALDGQLTLVTIELPGHGGSWPPLAAPTKEGLARHVLLVPDMLGLERFYVGGHSIGGMIALEVAAQCPERVKGVVSVEGWTSHCVLQDAFGGDLDSTLSAALRARLARMREKVTRRWTHEQVESFARVWTRWDGWPFLSRTDLPVLEIWGDRGQRRPDPGRLGVPCRDNIDLRWVHNASHHLPSERPAEVAREISDFIGRVEHRMRAGPG